MTVHIRMDDRIEADRLEDMAQGVVGKPLDRPDGARKASGTAAYAMDSLPDGACFGVLARATIAAGRLEGVDAAAVEALPGVRAVIVDERMLRNPAQGMAGKAPVQDPHEIA